MHAESHELANTDVKVKFKAPGHFQLPYTQDPESPPLEAYLEDWWDKVSGKSWTASDGNPAAMIYGFRAGIAELPTDDEVVYMKIGYFGHIVHTSELVIESGE